ncbi:MAG TPA: hypothetical protein VHF89_08710 [Solirubrobacteraceae bacterium]|nr:hypothetical protein [Solirubrobacteraceae bacterium]
MRRLPLLAAVAATATLAAAPAAAAPTLKFKGKNDQNRPLTFKLRNGKVVDFVGGVNLFCIGEGIQFNAAIPPRAMRVTNGRFRYKGNDKEGNSTIEISGRINGRRANGKLGMVSSRYSSSEGRVISCSADTKWNARAR